MVLDRAWYLASQYSFMDGYSWLGGAVLKHKGQTEGEQKSLFNQNISPSGIERRN
jgi:hypothetical protein